VDRPQSYLCIIATNLIRDHWRKIEREHRAPSGVTPGLAGDLMAFPVQDVDVDVDVRNLIASLPPRLRDPFLLGSCGPPGTRWRPDARR